MMFSLYSPLDNECFFYFYISLAFQHGAPLSELYFGEQLRVQTVEVKSKLYTGPQSVMLMKRFRVNRGEERPTL